MISVLIVDDNHSFVDSLRVILKDIPAIQNIKSVSNFYRAEREIHADEKYHLYILENDAEVSIKGIDFIKNIRKEKPNLKPQNFILLSTKPQDIAEKAKNEGIKIVRKPLQIQDFKEYINRLIDQRLIMDNDDSNEEQ